MTVNVDPKQVFVIPKFWGGVVSVLLGLLIAMIGYVYVYQIEAIRKDMYKLQDQIKDAEIRQFATIDVLGELRPEKDILFMVQRQQMKYYRSTVRVSNERTN